MPCISDEFYSTLEEYCDEGEEIYIAAASRLYFSENAQHWQYTGVEGVSVVLRSNGEYYIRIYDVDDGELLFVQKLYKSFEYFTPQPWFHYFEIQGKIAGLSFASEAEALEFSHHIKLCCDDIGGTVSTETPKQLEQQQTHGETSSSLSNSNLNVNVKIEMKAISRGVNNNHNQQPETMNQKIMKKKGGKSGGILRRILKVGKSGGKEQLSIGNPTSFQHCGHIGFSGEGVVTEGIPLPFQQLFVAKITKQAVVNQSVDSHFESKPLVPHFDHDENQIPVSSGSSGITSGSSSVPPPPAPPLPPPPKVVTTNKNVTTVSLLSEIRSNIDANVAAAAPSHQGDTTVYSELKNIIGNKLVEIRDFISDDDDNEEDDYCDDDDDEWW